MKTPHSALPVPHSRRVPEVGIEPTSSGSEPGILPLHYSGVLSHRHAPNAEVRGEGIEPSSAGSKPAGLPVSRSPNSFPSGKGGSRTHKPFRVARFRGGGHRQLA